MYPMVRGIAGLGATSGHGDFVDDCGVGPELIAQNRGVVLETLMIIAQRQLGNRIAPVA